MNIWWKLWKERRTSGLLPYGHLGVQLLVLQTDGEELRSEPATKESNTKADYKAEGGVSEEMWWVTPVKKDVTADDTTGYNVRSLPRRQVWRTSLFAPRKRRQGLKTRT